MQVRQHIALAPYTTFRIGGAARYFVIAKKLEDIKESLDFARDQNQKVLILGGGSNMLVSDEGFEGLVLKLELQSDFTLLEQGDAVQVHAEAGMGWDELANFSVQNNLWGLENLSGIPGSVGGAVVQGIGAYGAAIGETLQSVQVFDTQTREIRTLRNAECEFGYRGSIFKKEDGRYIVLSAAFALSCTPQPKLSYKDLAHRFGGQTPTIQEIRAAVLEIRAAKFPDLSIEGTAGSFFKNPIMPAEEAAALKEKYPDMPLFSLAESSDIKVPLGWFLDYTHGVMDLRDVRVGGARMFEKQFLVLVAARGASANDVKKLASLVQKKVFEELKIKIEPEVKII